MMEAFDHGRWVVGLLALAAFALVAIENVYILWCSSFRKSNISLVPVVGGLLGALGCIIIPLPRFIWFAWVPMVVDIGCLPYIGIGLLQAHRDKQKGDNGG